MKWLSRVIIPFTLLVGVVSAQDDAAKTAFQRMEQSIVKAKSFKTDVEMTIGSDKGAMKGRLLVAQGNKMRLDLEGSLLGKTEKMTMVSDGTKMKSMLGPDQETPKQLTELTLASVSRSGVLVPVFLAVEVVEEGKKPEPFNLEKDLAVSDFKLGKKEAVLGKEAQAVEYSLKIKGAKEPVAVTVWIETKTNLPLKRVIAFKEGNETINITETYTNSALDGKIDGKEFELPK